MSFGDFRKENNYEKILDKLIHSIWNESNELNSLAWNYYEKYNDEKQLTKAVNWAARSVELKNAYANNDTWAAILYKLGKKNDALERAKIAIEIAKKDGDDFSSTSKLIEKIETENK